MKTQILLLQNTKSGRHGRARALEVHFGGCKSESNRRNRSSVDLPPADFTWRIMCERTFGRNVSIFHLLLMSSIQPASNLTLFSTASLSGFGGVFESRDL